MGWIGLVVVKGVVNDKAVVGMIMGKVRGMVGVIGVVIVGKVRGRVVVVGCGVVSV